MPNSAKLICGLAFIIFGAGIALVHTSNVHQQANAYCAKSGMNSTMVHNTVLCVDPKTRLLYAPE